MTILIKPESYQIANFNFFFSDTFSDFADDIAQGECSKWNFVWLIPANLGSSIFGIIYLPMSVIAHLVASLVYRILECCECNQADKNKMRYFSNIHLSGSVEALIDKPLTLFARMGEMRTKSLTNCGERILNCLLRNQSWAQNNTGFF